MNHHRPFGIETFDRTDGGITGRRGAVTIVTSNRTPDEWLTMMADPLLAQSAVDRLVSTAHELIIEGPSYRQRQKPSINGHTTGVSVDDEKGNPHDHS